jgi:phosphatidylethanolamine-binding protein (PEBP) family uncharacterized protein
VKLRDLAISGSCLLAAALIAGCGGGGATTAAKLSPVAKKPPIKFVSSAVDAGKTIPASFRCDTRDNWLPLSWGALPHGTQELVLYVVRFGSPQATPSGAVRAPIASEALVVRLKPTLHRLSPGKFPAGALVAVHTANGHAISICPPKGVRQNMLFRLYALPNKLQLKNASNLVQTMDNEALGAGTFVASYRSA